MNLVEFKRRLMTDPTDRSPEMLEARAAGKEFAEAAAESDRFERMLRQALDVPAPQGLADQVILRQSLDSEAPVRSSWPRLTAMAAAVALAVAVTVAMITTTGDMISRADLEQHIVWHWQHDGAQFLEAATGQMQQADIEQIFSELGLQAGPELLDKVRFTKFCPTPDGAGAHIVLATDFGPVTIFYMPRTQIPGSLATVEIDDGMMAFARNVERGSIALIADAGIDIDALARDIAGRLSFAPGMTI